MVTLAYHSNYKGYFPVEKVENVQNPQFKDAAQEKKVHLLHVSVQTQQKHLSKQKTCGNIFLSVVFSKSVLLVIYN